MSEINRALSMASSPNYSIDQILQTTTPAKQPGGFRRVLGGIVGAVGNVFAPGIGGMIGSAISGNTGINQTGLMNDSMQYLQLQKQMNMEQQAFETASSVMKARHDASMAAIRNMT
ncbi:MAG TPA: hypothetical protein VH088_11670 [Terriglobales bacterium]|jgi:hypothetical protein|nr:hypothetical protein [Terriglobales bacterium]